MGKPRGAYPLESVERELLRYATVEGIERDEGVIDVSRRQILSKTAESVAADSGSDDREHVRLTTSGDTTPRRYWYASG